MIYINLTITQFICLNPESKTTVSNGTQENKTGCSKRKLENLSGETGSSHKNKKSRSSRHHKVDQEGDHKEDHKRDRKGDHKGDHIGDCKVDRKLDHKGDHKDDPTPNGAREKISGGISQQKTENKKKSCPQPADEGTNTVKSSSESTAKAKDKGSYYISLLTHIVFTLDIEFNCFYANR